MVLHGNQGNFDRNLYVENASLHNSKFVLINYLLKLAVGSNFLTPPYTMTHNWKIPLFSCFPALFSSLFCSFMPSFIPHFTEKKLNLPCDSLLEGFSFYKMKPLHCRSGRQLLFLKKIKKLDCKPAAGLAGFVILHARNFWAKCDESVFVSPVEISRARCVVLHERVLLYAVKKASPLWTSS